MPGLLPDSRLTCMVFNNDVFALGQTYEGDIKQFAGEIDASANSAFYPLRSRHVLVAERKLRGNPRVPTADSPKLFTPIAAVAFNREFNQPMTDKFVIYLDDNDILRDYHQSGNGYYEQGTLAGLGVKCGHYSSLAAVMLKGTLKNFINVYYQDPGAGGAVHIVSYNGYYQRWERGPANLRDPPLFGTSITALKPSPAIQGRYNPGMPKENESQSIYWLQLDDNKIGSGQGEAEPLALSGYEAHGNNLVFSPHTSLSAVDDGSSVHLVYKSHSGKIKVLRVDTNGIQGTPLTLCEDVVVAPRSSIAACLAPKNGADTNIVLFFQSLDMRDKTRKVVLSTRTAWRRTTAAPTDPWQITEHEHVSD